MRAIEKIRSKLRQIKATPEKISKGYALGVFLGTTPLIGTKVFIALGLTSFLKWSKIASVIGVYHINLFTAPAFYSAAFFTGKLVTRSQVNLEMPEKFSFQAFLQLFVGSPDILLAITVGGLILGLPMTVVAYYFSYSILKEKNR
jgi:uncharacterized protein (DUF2062 family)